MPDYKTYSGALKGAAVLLTKLQNKIDDDPSQFCENYGQSEIREFEDKLGELHYVEKCNVMNKLYTVSSMTPNF